MLSGMQPPARYRITRPREALHFSEQPVEQFPSPTSRNHRRKSVAFGSLSQLCRRVSAKGNLPPEQRGDIGRFSEFKPSTLEPAGPAHDTFSVRPPLAACNRKVFRCRRDSSFNIVVRSSRLSWPSTKLMSRRRCFTVLAAVQVWPPSDLQSLRIKPVKNRVDAPFAEVEKRPQIIG